MKFDPFHATNPGLSIVSLAESGWQLSVKIDEIYAVIDEGSNVVKLEIRDYPRGLSIEMSDMNELESFVSLLAGYYRLMVKWTVDLCPTLPSPTLSILTAVKIHGPVGSEFSYMKLRIREMVHGVYIIRQCDERHDIYFIDVVVK